MAERGAPSAGSPPPALPWWRRRSTLVWLTLATLIGFSPIISLLLTSLIAETLGCTVNEAASHPCPGPFGWDLGDLLVTMFVMGWLMLVTWPLMLGTIMLWIILIGRRLTARAGG